jgi:hypothetical protein
MRPEGLGKLKKCIHLIGSRTRDHPACSIVPQALRYRVPRNGAGGGQTAQERGRLTAELFAEHPV